MNTKTLSIPSVYINLIINHANSHPAEEVCGLLGGTESLVKVVYRVTNILHSPTAFYMRPEEQLNMMQQIEKLGYELLGIYHSHPNGIAFPSERDIASHYYPGVYTLITYRVVNKWHLKCFNILSQGFEEICIQVA